MIAWISFSLFLLSAIMQADYFLFKREKSQLYLAWFVTIVAWGIHALGESV